MEELDRVVEELKNRVIGYDPQDIERYLNESKIKMDENTLMRVLQKLIEDKDIFRWLLFICEKLPLIAKADSRFLHLISKIIQKVKNDMASRILEKCFIEIGSKNPQLGIKLFQMAAASNDQDLKLWSGLFLGGAGRTEPNLIFEKMELEYEKADCYVRAAFIVAIRILARDRTEIPKIPDRVLSILKQASEDCTAIVRSQAIASCIELFDVAPEVFGELLYELAINGASEDRLFIAWSLKKRKIPNNKLDLDILRICSEDSDINVLKATSLALLERVKENSETALDILLDILKKWINTQVFHEIQEVDQILDGLRGTDLEILFYKMESWIEQDEKGLLRLEIPRILSKIFVNDPCKLVRLLSTWRDKDTRFTETIISTLSEILSGIYSGEVSEGAIYPILELLKYLAEKKRLNINQIISSEQDKLFQAFRLIKELKIERPELDYDEIFRNLNDYPAIQIFLGRKWFEKMKHEKNKTHPLLIFLARLKTDKIQVENLREKVKKEKDELMKIIIDEEIKSYLYSKSFLEHLNTMLIQFDPKEQGIRHIRNGLRNEDQFWQTISELEIATPFKSKYPTIMQPKVDGVTLDAQIILNNTAILIEVISPETYKPLQYVSGFVVLKNRAKRKIAEKIDCQLKKLLNEIDCPLILAIDIGRSEINYEDITFSLEGSPVIEFLINKETHQTIAWLIRSNDSLAFVKPEVKIISAIVAFKCIVDEKSGKIMEA